MSVSEQIIQVLDNLCEKFGFAIDWTSDNIIPYLTTLCEKLVSYEIWTSVVWIVILSTVSALIILYTRKTFEVDRFFIRLFSLPFCFIHIIVQVMDIIKCVTFPELFVFEYIKQMINNMS